MSRHLSQDLAESYHRLLALSGQVEEMIAKAVRSLMRRQMDVAKDVVAADAEIDRLEVRIEEECLKMLALHQPVAADLRRLTTMMKVNNDLERIADLACNIAERACDLIEYPAFPIPTLLDDMATESIGMVRESLDAFVNLDIDLAYQVIQKDDGVDDMNVRVIDEVTGLMNENPAEWIDPAIHSFSAARSLEQIADHAVAVSEDVIYMVNGVIVRHRHNDPRMKSTH